MNTDTSNSNKKIDEALHLLNEAAKEKKEEMQKLFIDKYTHLKEAVSEVIEDKKETLAYAGKLAQARFQEGQEFVEGAVKDLDKEVRKNPWPYIGGVAAGALLLGFILGNSKK